MSLLREHGLPETEVQIPRLRSSTFRYVATETTLYCVREMPPDNCVIPYNVSEDNAATNMSLSWYQFQHIEWLKIR